MKKIVLGLAVMGLFASSTYAKNIQQTICFSKEKISEYAGRPIYQGVLGDAVSLYGGKCQGRNLPEMNKKGWKLIQVVGGLNSSFGMVLER